MNNLRKLLFETLLSLGAKKKNDSFKFIKKGLLIKHKDSGVKYTVFDINLPSDSKKSYVTAYRYYGPKSDKKLVIKIPSKDFDKYEPV